MNHGLLILRPDEWQTVSHLFQRLASRLAYLEPSLRAPADLLRRNQLGQSALWTHGISGDLPIALLRIDDQERAQRGAVHVLRADLMPREDRDLVRAAARVVLLSRHGTLAEQLDRWSAAGTRPPAAAPADRPAPVTVPTTVGARPDLGGVTCVPPPSGSGEGANR